MRHWPFIAAAYLIATGILLGYWRRVERRIRTLEAAAGLGDSQRRRPGGRAGAGERT